MLVVSVCYLVHEHNAAQRLSESLWCVRDRTAIVRVREHKIMHETDPILFALKENLIDYVSLCKQFKQFPYIFITQITYDIL